MGGREGEEEEGIGSDGKRHWREMGEDEEGRGSNGKYIN